MTVAETPLTARLPEEVHLPSAPLVRVLSQVRFPLVASIERREFVAPFQEAIRDAYPVLRQEASQTLALKPDGTVETSRSHVWRFSDSESPWRVTLAPDFVSIETDHYSNREEFLNRLRMIVEALKETVNPRHVDRLGVRYIDQVAVGSPSELSSLVRSEVAGILSTPLASFASLAIAENLLALPDDKGTLMARWGLIPKGATVDPSALPPLESPSWVLDLDASREATRSFESEALVQEARYFSERIYAFFRWAVQDGFLRRFGGKL